MKNTGIECNCSLDVLIERDKKELYRKPLAGERFLPVCPILGRGWKIRESRSIQAVRPLKSIERIIDYPGEKSILGGRD